MVTQKALVRPGPAKPTTTTATMERRRRLRDSCKYGRKKDGHCRKTPR